MKGSLLIIGGSEDKIGDMRILRRLAQLLRGGKLVIATVASSIPAELWDEYDRVFRHLGIDTVEHLNVATRDQAFSQDSIALFEGAAGVFFTGGDQLKITSKLACTPIHNAITTLVESGGIVAGTSAGASAISEAMLVGSGVDDPYGIHEPVHIASGLGLLKGVMIDQHFRQRGRFARLLRAISQNPQFLGIGLDEDTALLSDSDERLQVVGQGAVHILDASTASWTEVAENEASHHTSLFDLRLHVLTEGDQFDLRTRRPSSQSIQA